MSDVKPRRRTLAPKLVALLGELGLFGMLVLIGFQFRALTRESGDRVLHLSYAEIGVGLLTTLVAAVSVAWASQKAVPMRVLRSASCSTQPGCS